MGERGEKERERGAGERERTVHFSMFLFFCFFIIRFYCHVSNSETCTHGVKCGVEIIYTRIHNNKIANV